MYIKPFFALLLFLINVFALDAKMTDDQVVNYVKEQHALGKNENEIGRELISRGVTTEQLTRLKATYDREKNNKPATRTAAEKAAITPSHQPEDTHKEELAAQPMRNDGSNEVYGHYVFNSRALTFEPNENAATPQDYRLGPGDEVVIDIWGDSEDHLRQTITPEGSIMIAQLGPIYLNGLTIGQAADHIRSAFATKYAGVGNNSTEIALTLGQMRTIQIDIMGEVSTPGTYRLSPFSNIFHALYKAGGINDIGTMRNVELVRNGKKLAVVDIYDFLFNGNQTGNIRLQEGDLIIVPPYERIVTLIGNVKRPMRYEVKPGETLAQVIEYAGGFKGDAYSEHVSVSRHTGKENELLNIDRNSFGSYILNDGDVIRIGVILDRFANRVELRGAAMRPGIYAIGDGLRTVRDLIRHADGLSEDAYTGRAMLYREADDLSLVVESFDLSALLAGSTHDIQLRRNDVLVIANTNEINDKGGVTISGRVASPGVYPFAENMTVEDLILQAGGLLEGASHAKVDVSRRIVDPMATEASGTIAEVFTFSLKDGLLMGDDHQFVLKPYDIIEIRNSPNYIAQQMVGIKGEVTFSGSYVLQKRNERISELVGRAGGITPEAYVRGAHLMRRMTDAEIVARDESLRLAMGSSGNDSISVEKLMLSNIYSVGIDLEKALSNPGSNYDIVLREGDQLYVPALVSTVKIAGEVMFPNTVTYEKGKKIKDYINQAGGYGNRANKGKTFIVYMNGTVARAKGNTPIEPGCQIIVPSKPDKKGVDWAKVLSITGAIGSLGTMAAAIASIIRN